MKIKIIIPARYNSSRFRGKPLIKINGKSMIYRVWSKAILGLNVKDTWIATDSKKIFNHCKIFTPNVVMTSNKCKTGTDRINDCIGKINFDVAINIQGDEPMINVKDIKKVINLAKKYPKKIFNCMTPIKTLEDFKSKDTPKVVTNNKNELMYISRSPIPFSNKKNIYGYKQVCIYSFPKYCLKLFGIKTKKSINEKLEDIEILRLLDFGYSIKMISLNTETYAVDRPKDVLKIQKLIK